MHISPDLAHGPAAMPGPLDSTREPLRIDEQRNDPAVDGIEAGTITGRRCVVAFNPDHHEIRFHDAPPGARLTVRVHGRAGLAHTTANAFAREVVSDGAACVERCFVFHDLPLAVLEWTSGEPAGESPIRLEIHVHTAPPAPLWRVGEGAVRIDAAGRTFTLLASADARLAVREDLDAVRIDAVLPASATTRIAIAAALVEGDDIESTLDAARNADRRIRARTASLRRRDRDSIRLRSSDPVADSALRNAVQRLDAVPRLAVGDPADHGRPSSEQDRPGPPPGDLEAPATPVWTRDLERIGHSGRLALAALIAGDPAMARAMINVADPEGHTVTGSPSVPSKMPLKSLLARLGYAWTGDRAFLPPESTDPQPPDPADDPPPAGLAACRIVAFDPLLADSVAGPILGLALDVLGAAPDAARGRFRLRPVLPLGWLFMEVTDLPMADARIRLRMARTPAGIDIEIEQTQGAMPINAILEPVVVARALVGATIDGQPASLVPRPLGDRIRVPVQLALDHTRRLYLDLV
jgi:hypothetical protein